MYLLDVYANIFRKSFLTSRQMRTHQLNFDEQSITDKESIASHFCKYYFEIKLRIYNQFKRSPFTMGRMFTADKLHLFS